MLDEKNSIDYPKKYIWWKDQKMLGSILLILLVTIQIFAFLKIEFLTTINSYTIGFLFGYFNPFFYLFFIYYALLMIFPEKIKLPQWIKLSTKYYWFLIISIIFISTSSGYYQTKLGWKIFGTKSWNTIKVWFNIFTKNQEASFWLPELTNGGFIGALSFSFIAMIFSGIGALVLAIILICTSLSIIISGTILDFYKKFFIKKKITLIKNNKLKKNEFNNQLSNNINNPILKLKNKTNNNKKLDKIKEETIYNDYPFEDPFGDK